MEKVEKLLWIDLEMTGLDIEKEVIIEAAAIVTDFDLKELDRYEVVVKQPQEHLDKMDEWNTKHHRESGLTAKVPHGKSPELVETDLVDLVKKHFTEPAILAGNSIGQDRLFIKKYFKNLELLLHYRMLDVTAFKVVFNNKFNLEYEKKNAHRALEDIMESIKELQYFLSFVKSPSQPSK